MGRRRFHDTKLSPLLDAARHAVAIDERRWDFEPTLWRLDDIEGEPGLDLSRYKQEWFPGVHGAVGGGCPEVKLSSEALLWVLEGARERGLRVDGGMKRGWGEAARYDGDLRAGYKGGGGLTDRVFRIRSRDRTPVAAFTDVSDTARRRWHRIRGYRPIPLAALGPELDAWHEPAEEPPAE